jgi:hypothetical protein
MSSTVERFTPMTWTKVLSEQEARRRGDRLRGRWESEEGFRVDKTVSGRRQSRAFERTAQRDRHAPYSAYRLDGSHIGESDTLKGAIDLADRRLWYDANRERLEQLDLTEREVQATELGRILNSGIGVSTT